MEPTVIGALISGAAAVIVGIITLIGVRASNSKTQAVLEERVAELTREVRKHNGFAERVPVLENKVENIEEDLKELKKELKGRA